MFRRTPLPLKPLILLAGASLLSACGGGGGGSDNGAANSATPNPGTPAATHYYSYVSDNKSIYAVDRSVSAGPSTIFKVATLQTPPASTDYLHTISVTRVETDANNQPTGYHYDLLYTDNGRLYYLPSLSQGLPTPRQISNSTVMNWDCKDAEIHGGGADSTTYLTLRLPSQTGGCSSETALIVNLGMTATSAPQTIAQNALQDVSIYDKSGTYQGYLRAINNQLLHVDAQHNSTVLANGVTSIARNGYRPDFNQPSYAPELYIDVTSGGITTLYHYDLASQSLGPALGQNINLQTQKGNTLYAFKDTADGGSGQLYSLPLNGLTAAQPLSCTQSFTGKHHLYSGQTSQLVVMADTSVYRITSPDSGACTATTLSSTLLPWAGYGGDQNLFYYADLNAGTYALHTVSMSNISTDTNFYGMTSAGGNRTGLSNAAAWNAPTFTHLIALTGLNSNPLSLTELDYTSTAQVVLGNLMNLPTSAFRLNVYSYDLTGLSNNLVLVVLYNSSGTLTSSQLYGYESQRGQSLTWITQFNGPLNTLNLTSHPLN